MSTKRRRTGQSSSRSGAAREPPQEQQFLPQLLQQLLPELLEKENAAVLDKLPRDVWERIVDSIGRKDLFSFAMTCRYFRDLRQDAVAAANDSESRWETVMTTKLKTYSYIETTESDCIYPPSIEESKYPLVPLLLPPLFAFTDEALSCPVFYSGMLSVSADYVKWLFREASSTHCREAALAKGRRYDGVDWWDAAQGARWGERDIMELAAIRGDLDLIKWLRSQDPPCEWGTKACMAAAWANRWDLLRHLLSMGCPLDKNYMFGVVACETGDPLVDSWDGGKLVILKWLQREHGCAFGGYWKHAHIKQVVKAAGECSDFPSIALLFSHH